MASCGVTVRDTTGAIRIAHSAMPPLTPCNCRCRLGETSCRKNYCPCRKAGFYCGPSCKCRNHCCGNQPPSEQIEPLQEPMQEPMQEPPQAQNELTEEDLLKCEEILMHSDEIDISHLLNEDDAW